ncbi:MAG: hypothetical protein ACSHX7_11180, partial [Luteolibacter sp.]
MTPPGSWSLELSGNFLQCRKNGQGLVLRYVISGKDGYHVDFVRKVATFKWLQHKPSLLLTRLTFPTPET